MKTIHFSKAFLPTTIISSLIILSGFVGIATKGLNYGLDFKPGLMTEVRVSPTALAVGYTGVARAAIDTSSTAITVTVSGAGDENASTAFTFAEYPTVAALAAGLRTVPNITADVQNAADATPTSTIFVDSSVSAVLGAVPYRYHFDNGLSLATRDAVDEALSSLGAEVQQIGAADENRFQIRVGAQDTDTVTSDVTTTDTTTSDSVTTDASESADTTSDSTTTDDTTGTDVTSDSTTTNDSTATADVVTTSLSEQVVNTLKATFGADNVATISTDFVGAQFSRSLAFRSIWVVLASLVLVLLYSMVRFKWDFGTGAVLAIVHDALVMLAFIAWTGMEFSTTILAAILTVIGYSINDTIVVLDRVRENQRTLSPSTPITSILDDAQTQILSRTIITTATTLLAVVALYVFTSGTMKDFALCLIVGMVSGVYSTIYITGAFIAAVRRQR
jgi:preprotein translocase subunit SecF